MDEPQHGAPNMSEGPLPPFFRFFNPAKTNKTRKLNAHQVTVDIWYMRESPRGGTGGGPSSRDTLGFGMDCEIAYIF